MKSAFEIYPISVPIQSEKKKICFFIDSTSSLSLLTLFLIRKIYPRLRSSIFGQKFKRFCAGENLKQKESPLKKGSRVVTDTLGPKKGSVSGSLFSDFNSLLSATRSQRESSGELLLCRRQTRLGCT
jgi:hypothetical protein